MTNEAKRKLLAKYIEYLVWNGYAIDHLLGRPLVRYEFSVIEKRVKAWDRLAEAGEAFDPEAE